MFTNSHKNTLPGASEISATFLMIKLGVSIKNLLSVNFVLIHFNNKNDT